MVTRNEFLRALAISILIALITMVPYIAASFLVKPSDIFGGFLINPIDGFSYLAKMRQGYDGQWLFHLPYTLDPGKGTFIFVYFLFLGHLSKWLGVPSIYIYHAVRFLGSVLMFGAAFILITRFLKNHIHRLWAFVIVVLGAGLGWLALPFGLLASDLWIVESIPFLTAYANAHFPIATALFLSLIIIMISKHQSIKKSMGLAILASTLLAAIQPFSIITLFIFLLLWILWETWIEVREQRDVKNEVRVKWLIYFAMIIGALPWLIYDYCITLSHPEIAEWNAQNITPSPSVIEYVFGFGAILIISIFGLFTRQFSKSRTERFLMVWMLAQAILLYAPFGLQRRLSLGLYFPLVIIAVLTLDRLIRNKKKLQFVFLLLLIISIPSNLVVIGSGIAGVMKKDPFVVLDNDEMQSYHWLSSNVDPGKIILAGPMSGNRIPAFADLRVFYGHPFETTNAKEQRNFIEQAYSSEDDKDETFQMLQELEVSYVFYGPEERELGQPQWLENLEVLFTAGEYSIYEIPMP